MEKDFSKKNELGLHEKERALQEIAQEIEHCERCQQETTGLPVPGEGNANAQVVFVGEAPGKLEAKTGQPFIGRSGKFLRQAMEDIGLVDADVFITSVLKYLPVKGTPTQKQITLAKDHLAKQLVVIHPKVVVLLGSVAARGVLGEPFSITKMHGKVLRRDDTLYFFSYHPAAAIRFQSLRQIFLTDFARLRALLEEEKVL